MIRSKKVQPHKKLNWNNQNHRTYFIIRDPDIRMKKEVKNKWGASSTLTVILQTKYLQVLRNKDDAFNEVSGKKNPAYKYQQHWPSEIELMNFSEKL